MPTAKGAARTLPHPLSAPCCGPMAVARAPMEVGKQLKSCHLASEELATLNLRCRKVRANRLNHKNTAKAKRGEGGETQALIPCRSPTLVPRCPCHRAARPDPAGKASVSLPAYEPTQLSWQAAEREKSWLRFQLFWSKKEGGAESSEKLLKCQLLSTYIRQQRDPEYQ